MITFPHSAIPVREGGLLADTISGSQGGHTGRAGQALGDRRCNYYDDYVEYQPDTRVDGTAYYDADANNVDEGNIPPYVTEKPETHETASTRMKEKLLDDD